MTYRDERLYARPNFQQGRWALLGTMAIVANSINACLVGQSAIGIIIAFRGTLPQRALQLAGLVAGLVRGTSAL